MLAFWEDRHLVEIFGEPGSRLGDRLAALGGELKMIKNFP
jgi:hypothetical protein